MTALRKIGSLFGSGPSTVKQASLLLAFTALLSTVLGLFRNVLFNRLIDKAQLDIYYASFRIPDFLFNILIFGAISSAFVPLISGMLSRDKQGEARVFADQTFTWITVIFGALGLILVAGMEPLMRLVVHGFDSERFATAVLISRILMAQSIFFAWSFTCGGYLNSFKRFASPALAPLIYNIAIIAGAFVAVRHGVIAIAYAVVVGAFLHFAIQFYELTRSGYFPRWDLRLSQEIRELGRLMLPRSISQGMSQFALIIFTALASGLTKGSITILANMNDLQTTPTVILVNSLAVALFPTIAAKAATADWEELNRLLQKAFRLTLTILIPSIIMGFVLRAQIVRLYFSIGGANWDLTNLAIATFVGFLVGVIPTAFVVLLSRVFYALKDTRTPMILSVIAGICGVTFAVVSIYVFDGTVASLALADAVISIVQCTLYLIVLRSHPSVRLGLGSLVPRIIKYTIGGGLAGFATWLTLQFVDLGYVMTHSSLTTHSVAGLFLQFVIAGLVGLLVILSYSRAVLKEEFQWMMNRRSTTNQ